MPAIGWAWVSKTVSNGVLPLVFGTKTELLKHTNKEKLPENVYPGKVFVLTKEEHQSRVRFLRESLEEQQRLRRRLVRKASCSE
jgi:hypothetical protein